MSEVNQEPVRQQPSLFERIKNDTVEFIEDIKVECFSPALYGDSLKIIKENWSTAFYTPYFPAFHSPGWLLRYALGPHTLELAESFVYDIWAGITVALTLIPQGLSYAKLANLPPINGLYTAVLPSATYTFFGSSMQLGVGPVAIVSLLMGQLITNQNIDYVNKPQDAVAYATECSIAVGIILTVLSVLNMGSFIRFVSHPVMSGFTTSAAALIGLNQLKAAFGFTISVPQQGQSGFDYNFQVMRWYHDNWWEHTFNKAKTYRYLVRNPLAEGICFGLYFPLVIIQIIRNYLPESPERKKSLVWNVWNVASSFAPFVAIVIGAHAAWVIKHADDYNNPRDLHHHYYANQLSIVGTVQEGITFIKNPSHYWNFSQVFIDVWPLSLIAFMESYSVAHRIATKRNELHLLSCSQELWAIGVANWMSGVSSSYPVAGSFSRSAINDAAGARTPLSKATTMIVIVIALTSLTSTFQYIPNAALAAVIWASIYNLIRISDFWHAWKHSKKDFLVMLVTATIVFLYDTGIGLGAGIGASLFVVFGELAYSPLNAPILLETNEYEKTGKIKHIQVKNDINFITAGRFTDLFLSFTFVAPVAPDTATAPFNVKLFYDITTTLDHILKPVQENKIEELPQAIVVDLHYSSILDLTSLMALSDNAKTARARGIKVVVINANLFIQKELLKFGFKNDRLVFLPVEDAESYYDRAGNVIPFIESKFEDPKALNGYEGVPVKELELVTADPLDKKSEV